MRTPPRWHLPPSFNLYEPDFSLKLLFPEHSRQLGHVIFFAEWTKYQNVSVLTRMMYFSKPLSVGAALAFPFPFYWNKIQEYKDTKNLGWNNMKYEIYVESKKIPDFFACTALQQLSIRMHCLDTWTVLLKFWRFILYISFQLIFSKTNF